MRADNSFRRRSEIAKIHIAKKALGLDDATYRDIIERVSCETFGQKPVRSAKLLNSEGRKRLIEEFKRLGFRDAPGRGARAERLERDPMERKIRACWLDMKNAGALDDASEAALRAFVNRMTGRAAMRFLSVDEANLVIESLKKWHERLALKASHETPG